LAYLRAWLARRHPAQLVVSVAPAATTLVALIVNAAFEWWWADPIVATAS